MPPYHTGMAKRPCAFCPDNEAKLTGEHLWSDWTNNILPKKPFLITRFGRDGVKVGQHKSQKLNIKVPVVCARCNNGWMSDVENLLAKPAMAELILSDKGVLLTPERVRSIATYA